MMSSSNEIHDNRNNNYNDIISIIDTHFWNTVSNKNKDTSLNIKTISLLNKYFDISLGIVKYKCLIFKKKYNLQNITSAKLEYIRIYEEHYNKNK